MKRRGPNVLIVHTDQQSCWSIGAYGGVHIDTPNIDRLGREGALFTQFFTNSAVCTPSRGCFFTGRYPHDNGAWINDVPLNRDEVTFAEVLRQQGYDTAYIGKWHLDGTPRPGWVHPERSMGFTDQRYMFNRGHWSKIEEAAMAMEPIVHPYEVVGDGDTYTTDFLTARTVDFISAERDAPFCAVVSIPDPHDPYAARPPYDTMFRPEDMELPETFSEETVIPWAEPVRASQRYALDRADREECLRRAKAEYLGAVKLIDDCVGRMLEALERQGILDNTIVVFTSDHGEYMGEHGLYAKNLVYETAYRIPLLVRWPQEIAAGTRIDRLVATVDFQTTLLGLLGVPPCGREQGHDASPLMRAESTAWEDLAFVYHSNHQYAGVFTDHLQLVYFRDHDPVLFDRVGDPQQLENVYGKPEHSECVQKLTERIVSHFAEHPHPDYEWVRDKGLSV